MSLDERADERKRARRTVAKGNEDALVYAIADVVAEVRGERPTDVGFTLADYLDPDALALLTDRSGERTSWEITLDLDDLDVVVRGDDRVTVVAR